MNEQSEEQLTAEIMSTASILQQTIEAFAKQAKRWDTDICPICKSSLNPADPAQAGHRSVLGITHQIHSKLQQITGHCGECMLSPAEVQEDEVKKWIWMRLPDALTVNGNNEFTLRVEGSTLREAIDNIGQKHPELRAEMFQAVSATIPYPALELSINWVPISELQGLETPVVGGDYVKFPPQAFL